MNQEIQVIIPLKEYEQMKKIKDDFITNFNKNKVQLNHVSYFIGHSGYPRNEYSIVTNSQIIKDLNDALGKLSGENYSLRTELATLNNTISNKSKSWF